MFSSFTGRTRGCRPYIQNHRIHYTPIRSYLVVSRVEAVGPVPVVIDVVRARYNDAGIEASQPPNPVREGAPSGIAGAVECATADSPVAGSNVEDGITVQANVAAFRSCGVHGRLGIENRRTGRDLGEV